ncbi:MAG: hypothetical protein K6A28_06065 [Bacteroidales bacterium]|nr:hypothetical protein [Bacteroidales bacterium]
MKAILVTYNQAYYDDVTKILNENGVKGYTEWNEIKGHGSETGEPHLGSHAWPTLNNAIISVVEDDKVEGILAGLRERDLKSPDLGLRAFVWQIEKMI